MNREKIAQIEQLLGRGLGQEEQERLEKIQSTLGIADNDALWDILIALEYQRVFYEALPEKIAEASATIFKQLSAAAEKEAQHTQGRLAEAVVEQAKTLSARMRLSALVLPGLAALSAQLLYGSLLLFAGYCIGSGQAQPPALMLRMPGGVLVGALFLGTGIFLGTLAAKDFSLGYAGWQQRGLLALGLLVAGAMLFGFTIL